MPAIFIAGFLPMFLTAYGYRELNRSVPDCGTSFTWATKAFGPYTGWLGGWGAVLATVIVLSNLAGVAVTFFYLFIARVTGIESIADLATDKLVNIITCLAFIAGSTWIAYRGISTTERLQIVLVGFQMLVLAIFTVVAITKAALRRGPARRALLLGLVQPVHRAHALRVRRGRHRLDLRVLGLGHLPHRQRGEQGRRQDARPGGDRRPCRRSC